MREERRERPLKLTAEQRRNIQIANVQRKTKVLERQRKAEQFAREKLKRDQERAREYYDGR